MKGQPECETGTVITFISQISSAGNDKIRNIPVHALCILPGLDGIEGYELWAAANAFIFDFPAPRPGRNRPAIPALG